MPSQQGARALINMMKFNTCCWNEWINGWMDGWMETVGQLTCTVHSSLADNEHLSWVLRKLSWRIFWHLDLPSRLETADNTEAPYHLLWAKLVVGISSGTFPGGSVVKNTPAKQVMWVQSLGHKDPLEKEMTTHSIILPGKSQGQSLVGYSPWGHKRVRHDLATKQQQKQCKLLWASRGIDWGCDLNFPRTDKVYGESHWRQTEQQGEKCESAWLLWK